MPEISMRNLLEAGVHFGHQTQRWNPKMRPFIFGPRNGIYIIDLEKTVKHAKEACTFVKNTVAEGGKVLFVATKKQAKEVTKLAAARANMPVVTERWLGGTLTNFMTIRKGVEKLEQLETWKQDGTYEMLPKKEVVVLERKRKKLEASLGGLRTMKSLPAALFVIDPEMERIAVAEANRLGIPVVAVVDTNCNPDVVDYVIPGNDDALKSVTLFVNLIADACAEGAQIFETRVRQLGGSSQQQQQTPATTPVAGQPIVQKVTKAQVRNIPMDIDYRAEAGLIDDEADAVATEAAQTTETAEIVEATSEAAPTAEAAAAQPAPAAKAPKASAEKKADGAKKAKPAKKE
jgi:small subunit ribosomal protein S2